MKIALLQTDLAWTDVEANHRRAADAIAGAAALGARLAILPEMFSTGFCMDAALVAQPEGGPSEAFLVAQAAAHGLWLIASVPQAQACPHAEEDAPPRNVALVVSPDGRVSRYAKIHPFSLAGEDRVYAAGDHVVTVDVDGLRVTPLVCYDLRFPEPFRVAAAETDLFVVVANWPERRRAHWRALLLSRAIENLAFVAGVNRVGEGDGLRYTGDSALHSPWGETLVSAAENPAVLVGEVDAAVVKDAREKLPVLADRRPAAYRRKG